MNAIGTQGGSGLLVGPSLVRAIRTESASALMHHFGVSERVVWKWRRRFGLGKFATPGSKAAHERASRAGTKAMKRRTYTEEERARRSKASKNRKPPDRWKGKHWTPKELALVGEDHDEAIAKRIGRTREAVRDRRRLLGIPAFSGWAGGGRPWSKEEDTLLGTDTDEKIAKCLDRTRNAVSNRRESLGIKPFVKRWTSAEDKLLGRMPDSKLAAKLGRSLAAVMHRRVAMGRPPSHK